MHSSCNASVIRQPGIDSQQTSKVERKTGEYVSIVPNYFLSNHANFGTGYSKESYDALKKYWKEVETSCKSELSSVLFTPIFGAGLPVPRFPNHFVLPRPSFNPPTKMCVSHAMDKVRNTELTEIPGIKKLPCSSIRLERMQLKQPNSSNRHEAVLPTSAGCTSQRSSFSRASRVNPIYPSFDELKYRLTRGRPIRKVNVEAEKQEGTSQNVHVPQEEELAPLVLNSRSRASSMPVLSPNHVDATLELGQPVNPAHQIRQEGNQVQPVLQPENLQVPQLPDHGQNLANIFSFAIGLDMRPVNQQQMARGIPYQNPIHPLLVMIPGENDEHLGLGRMPLQPDLVRNRQ